MTSVGSRVALVVVAACATNEPPASPPASAQSARTATAWFTLQLQLVRDTDGFTPPVASRAFAYSGVALYEAVVPGMPGYRSLAGIVHELDGVPAPDDASYCWEATANAALAAITRDMYATAPADDRVAIDALESQLAAEYAAPADVLARSTAYGRDVAAAIDAWSRSDGDNVAATDMPAARPGLWVPTPPSFLPAMQPLWGRDRTFVIERADACAVAPPIAYSTVPSSRFYAQANEVHDTSLHLTPEQQIITAFWSDDPPSHTISLATQALERRDSSLDVAAEAYVKTGLAVGDAFIASWASEYRYNLVRPVTYIDAVIDPTWLPLVDTPPFPEYPSSDAAQSAAAAQVLTGVLGDVPFTDHTNDARGLAPRAFRSFEAAAKEAAIASLYGGIHYRAAIENGFSMGACIGGAVNALPLH
jgi:hypothetical protein